MFNNTAFFKHFYMLWLGSDTIIAYKVYLTALIAKRQGLVHNDCHGNLRHLNIT